MTNPIARLRIHPARDVCACVSSIEDSPCNAVLRPAPRNLGAGERTRPLPRASLGSRPRETQGEFRVRDTGRSGVPFRPAPRGRPTPREASGGTRLRFSVWANPHRDFGETLDLALHAEASGWDGLWLADHFLPAGGDPRRPTLECWTALAALAARVPRLTLGPLVSGNTYRHPAVLAKMAAGVDRISRGRLILGIGAAWQENEHRAYGIAFPPLRERLERLDEACRLIRSLLDGERTDFAGRYYTLRDAVLEPKPLQRSLPLLVGGGGERRTLRIAARWAQAWNTWGDPAQMRHKIAVLDRHCEELGRDPATLRRSAVALFVLDGTAAPGLVTRGLPVIAGPAERVRDAVRAYAEAGVDELVVPAFAFGDGAQTRDALDRFALEVAAAFR